MEAAEGRRGRDGEDVEGGKMQRDSRAAVQKKRDHQRRAMCLYEMLVRSRDIE